MIDNRFVFLLLGAAVTLWSFRNWRQSLQLALVLLVVEGAIRKWLFPGSQELVYFAKDVVLLAAYGGYLRERSRLRLHIQPLPVFYAILAVSFLFGLFQVFNPNLPNLLVGIFGVKAYFFYVPLIFVLPAAFSSDTELYRFLRRYALLSILVGLLAVAQFFSPPSSPLNTYARAGGDTPYVTTFGSSSFVRVTATFSYISGYASYLVAAAILILALLGATRWRFRGNLFVYLALGMTALGMLMTGSRGPILLLALVFPLYWWLAVIREKQGGATSGRLIAGAALLAVFVAFVGQEALGAFRGRAAGSQEEVLTRLTVPLRAPLNVLPSSGLFGYGIGSTHQTAAALVNHLVPYSWLRGLIVEAETGRIMVELGLVGFLLIYFVRLYLIFLAFRYALSLRTLFHRGIVTACLLFFIVQLFGSVVFDVTTDVYYWFFAGLLLLAVRLDREAVARSAAKASTAQARSAGPTPVPAVWQPSPEAR